MIKITKPGQKEFHGFCKWCGCEFTYEISDLKLSATSDKVSCPTCGKDYHHNMMVQDPTIPGGIGYQWPSDSTDPCAGCVWRSNLEQGGIYIGDTPCTWCNKNKFNSLNVSTAPLTGTVQGISELATQLNEYSPDLDSACSCTSKEVPGTYTTTHNSCCDDTEGCNSCSGEHKCNGKKNCKGKH